LKGVPMGSGLRVVLATVLATWTAAACLQPAFAEPVEAVTVTGPQTGQDDDPDGIAAWHRHRIAVRVVAPLFPSAVFVRLYRCLCGFEAERMLARNEGWDRSVSLSRSEIATLRQSVFYAPKPNVWTACVYPNQYGFLFFDRDRRMIGMVASNATFRSVQILPANPPSDDMKDIMADAGRLKAIVENHSEALRNIGC
jgi:hypothetical protein